MDVMTESSPEFRTLCHTCRNMQDVYKEGADGVARLRLVPNGERMGRIVKEVANGLQIGPCPTCKGSGFLPGFQPPC